MEIIIGKTSGFCAGVLNAVTKTEKELDKENGKIFCLGELVHNRQVVEKLERKGLEIIENIEEATKKTIIRAHGVPKNVYENAKQREIELVDLTCPKVLQIHNIAEEYAKKGYYIILVGVENHPEVIGTISFCGENSYLVRDKEDIIDAVKKVNESQINKLLIIAQTTYSLKKFEEIVEELKKQFGDRFEIQIKNTICSATRLRQEETDKLSREVNAMIIVGGKNSSNTKKLYDIAKSNCENTVTVETIKDIDIKELKKYNKIGIMAGASTPNESVMEIVEHLKEQ